MKLVRNAPPRFVVTDGESCAKLLRRLAGVKRAGVDCETTTNLPKHRSRAVTVQISTPDFDGFVVEPYVRHLTDWVKADNPEGYFYSAKGDLWNLENAGVRWTGPVWDTMVMDYLLNENVKIKEFESGLKERVHDALGRPMRPGYAELFTVQDGRKKHLLGADELISAGRLPELIPYGCRDSRDTLDFGEDRKTALENLEWIDGASMWDYFLEYEAPFTKLLYRMERRGCLIDEDYLRVVNKQIDDELAGIHRQFYQHLGTLVSAEVLNSFSEKLMTSTQQLQRLFYDILQYPEQTNWDKKKKEERRTTDEDALTELARKHKLPKLLLRNRELNTLKNTFILGLLERVSECHRIHTDFIQAFTLTGRLSSRDPNLQNIPKVATDPFKIRKAFVAPRYHHLAVLDYSQIEMRIMAHLSGDEKMMAACEQSDIYAALASGWRNVPYDFFKKINGERSPEADRIRAETKIIALGLGFGKQAFSIAREMGVSEEKAQALVDSYFQQFPVLAAFMRYNVQQCKEVGFVRTITGRYRRIPNINHPDKVIRGHAERQALNSPIQGSARDVIVKAMLKIDQSGILPEYDAQMILTVHDELMFEVPDDCASEFLRDVQAIMEHPFGMPLSVSLPADGGIGANWAEAKH